MLPHVGELQVVALLRGPLRLQLAKKLWRGLTQERVIDVHLLLGVIRLEEVVDADPEVGVSMDGVGGGIRRLEERHERECRQPGSGDGQGSSFS